MKKIQIAILFMFMAIIISPLFYLTKSSNPNKKQQVSPQLEVSKLKNKNKASVRTISETKVTPKKTTPRIPKKISDEKLFDTYAEFLKILKRAQRTRQPEKLFELLLEMGVPVSWDEFNLMWNDLKQRRRHSSYYSMINGLASKFPLRMAKWALRIPLSKEKNFLLRQFIRNWASKDLAATEKFLIDNNLNSFDFFNDLILEIKDPKKLIEKLRASKDSNRQAWRVNRILMTWSKQDPLVALEWINNTLKGNERFNGLKQILAELAKIDAELALELVDEFPPNLQAYALSQYAAGLASIDPQAAMEIMVANSDLKGWLNFRPIISAWAKIDPSTVADYIINLDLKNKSHLNSMLYPLAMEWAKSSSWEAYDWSKKLPARERGMFQDYLIRNTIGSDPELAWELALETLHLYNKHTSLMNVASGWMDYNPEKALSRINEITDQDLKDKITARAFNHWASRDPAAFYDYSINKNIKLTNGQQVTLARHWFMVDPDATMEWFKSLEKDDKIDQIAIALAKNIASGNTEKALTFIKEHVSFENTDNALLNVISMIQHRKPQQALTLLNDLDPSNVNEKLYWNIHMNIARRLARNDLDNALKWAEGLDFQNKQYGDASSKAIESIINQISWKNPKRAAEIVKNSDKLSESQKQRLNKRITAILKRKEKKKK